MIAATMALAELAEKGDDIDVLGQRVRFVARRLMELDVDGRCGAGNDETARRAPSSTSALARS